MLKLSKNLYFSPLTCLLNILRGQFTMDLWDAWYPISLKSKDIPTLTGTYVNRINVKLVFSEFHWWCIFLHGWSESQHKETLYLPLIWHDHHYHHLHCQEDHWLDTLAQGSHGCHYSILTLLSENHTFFIPLFWLKLDLFHT